MYEVNEAKTGKEANRSRRKIWLVVRLGSAGVRDGREQEREQEQSSHFARQRGPFSEAATDADGIT